MGKSSATCLPNRRERIDDRSCDLDAGLLGTVWLCVRIDILSLNLLFLQRAAAGWLARLGCLLGCTGNWFGLGLLWLRQLAVAPAAAAAAASRQLPQLHGAAICWPIADRAILIGLNGN